MSAVRAVRLDGYASSSPNERQRCGRASFEVQQLTAARVRVAVVGDVDATTRQALGLFVERHTRVSKQLVLDLSAVNFFGSQGCAALYYIGVQCMRRDVDWVVVGNRIVQRIVSICDAEGQVSVVQDQPTAMSRLDQLMKYHNVSHSAG